MEGKRNREDDVVVSDMTANVQDVKSILRTRVNIDDGNKKESEARDKNTSL